MSVATLERWQAHALSSPARERTSTAAARLEAVIATAAIDDAQRSAWCREKGVFPSDLAQWRESAMVALAQPEEARANAKETRRSSADQGAGEGPQAQGESAGGDHSAAGAEKKTAGDLPRGRGRMISLEDRQSIARPVDEAHRTGARLRRASAEADITARTLQRWKRGGGSIAETACPRPSVPCQPTRVENAFREINVRYDT